MDKLDSLSNDVSVNWLVVWFNMDKNRVFFMLMYRETSIISIYKYVHARCNISGFVGRSLQQAIIIN